jgi:hypothetical protein
MPREVTNVSWWTVGNEQYGNTNWGGWRDLRSQPSDPTQYAQIVTKDYYSQMKAASNTPIDVCIDADPNIKRWDSIVLAEASYDCVDLHFYPQGRRVNDDFLVHEGALALTSYIDREKAELRAAGRPQTPIYVGELGSTSVTPGKQSQSITQALYAGQVLAELLTDGITRAQWHLGYGGCTPQTGGGDFDTALYGWQDWGGAAIFGQGPQRNCPGENVPFGTPLATADAYQVASHFVRNGEHMLGVAVSGHSDVRAYASTYAGGYVVMLFNLNQTTTAQRAGND